MNRSRLLHALTMACVFLFSLAIGGCLHALFLSLTASPGYTAGGAQVDSPVRHLDIEWTGGKVQVLTHDQSSILFSETSEKPIAGDARLHWQLDGDTLRIRYNKPGLQLRLFDGPDKELTVTLPAGLKPDSVRIRATSGTILLPALTARQVSLAVTSGEIRADTESEEVQAQVTSGLASVRVRGSTRRIRVSGTSGNTSVEAEDADRVEAELTSGTLLLTLPRAGEVRASSTSGTVHAVIGQARSLSVGTTSGIIRAEVGAADSVSLSATSGDITADLPASPGFTARVETTSGSFRHTLPMTQEGGAWVVGDGSGKYSLRSTSGDITIQPADTTPDSP